MPDAIDEITAGRLERVAPRALKLFGGRAAGVTLEAARGVQEAAGNSGLPNAADATAIATQIKRTTSSADLVGSAVAGEEVDEEADLIAAQLVARANEVLAQLRDGAPFGAVPADGAYALEAVLRVRGRPALSVEGDSIEPINSQKHPGSDFWLTFRSDHENDLVKVASATGAVMVKDLKGVQSSWVQGTAWLVKPDLMITNRHVLFPPRGGMRLARRVPGATTTAQFKADLEVTIDFAFDNREAARPLVCPTREVIYVSEEVDPIDVALISIDPPLDASQTLSPPLVLAADAGANHRYVYVVGHPGKVPNVPDKVLAVFGTPDERKRVSFGETMDSTPRRPNEIVYDASTIGGYSGGCVVPFMTTQVMGLHHYGDPLKGNRAFTAAALRAHAVAQFM
jgi:hypothetical protein